MGYGFACLKGLDYIENLEDKTDIVVFLDGDYSDYPEQMTNLLAQIENGFDLVIGSRALGNKAKGSMTFPQVFGNWLATTMMKVFYNAKYTDLGPFRAIKYSVLQELKMEDKNYGWTIEMQLKALKNNLTYVEVPVPYKQRIGESKISGTLMGTVMAGGKILGWIFKYSFSK